MANKRDIIVLAGKRHDPYQEINGKKYPFDERTIIKEILGEENKQIKNILKITRKTREK